MRIKKSNLTLSVVLLIAMIFSVSSITFAYFTLIGSSDSINRFEVSSATTGNAYTQSGSDISLDVAGYKMDITNADPDTPAFVGSNTTPVKIVLETKDNGGTLTCNYDITYTPKNEFTTSKDNLSNANEFTISGYNDKDGTIIPEINLANQTNKIILIENVEIYVEGVNKTLVQNWTFDVNFYNQPFSQDDNLDKSFGGTISIENLTCENIFLNS